jgi:hypothetical protein
MIKTSGCLSYSKFNDSQKTRKVLFALLSESTGTKNLGKIQVMSSLPSSLNDELCSWVAVQDIPIQPVFSIIFPGTRPCGFTDHCLL